MRSFAYAENKPKAVFAASVCQLQSIIDHYCVGQKRAIYRSTWQIATGMLYVANSIVSEKSFKDRQRYFMVCVRGFRDLAQ